MTAFWLLHLAFIQWLHPAWATPSTYLYINQCWLIVPPLDVGYVCNLLIPFTTHFAAWAPLQVSTASAACTSDAYCVAIVMFTGGSGNSTYWQLKNVVNWPLNSTVQNGNVLGTCQGLYVDSTLGKRLTSWCTVPLMHSVVTRAS